MRITERDIIVLKALDKFRVLDILTIQKLCNFTSYKICSRRMNILLQSGYLKYYQETVSSKRYYLLTQKAMNFLYGRQERRSYKGTTYIRQKKPPKFRKNTLLHEITVANSLYYILKCNDELSMFDFLTERELQMTKDYDRKKKEHLCDLFCEKYRVKIEVELTLKNKKDLLLNFYSNTANYVQIWIVGNNQIYNRLKKLKEENNNFSVYIIKLEELENISIDLAQMNKELFRFNAILREQLEHMKILEEKRKEVTQLSIDMIYK